jgi:sulfur carrier protein
MYVIVNGEIKQLPESQTLAALLLSLSPAVPFAVARNGEFVARATYEETPVRSGDQIDIVHPAAGG